NDISPTKFATWPTKPVRQPHCQSTSISMLPIPQPAPSLLDIVLPSSQLLLVLCLHSWVMCVYVCVVRNGLSCWHMRRAVEDGSEDAHLEGALVRIVARRFHVDVLRGQAQASRGGAALPRVARAAPDAADASRWHCGRRRRRSGPESFLRPRDVAKG